jgi:hypothetical protein
VRGIRVGPPEADRVLIVGSTGDGKSTVARYVINSFQPVRTLICDSKGDINWPDAATVRTAGELRQAIAANIPAIRWVPRSFDRKYMDECWEAIHEAIGPLIVWVDEAAEHCSPNRCPEGLRLDITQGRAGKDPKNPQDEKRGPKLMVICTQRINECHPVIRTQAEHIIVMTPPPAEIDLKAIAGNLRRSQAQVEAELTQLHQEHGNFSHLWYCKPDNDLRRMAPIPLEAIEHHRARRAAARGAHR